MIGCNLGELHREISFKDIANDIQALKQMEAPDIAYQMLPYPARHHHQMPQSAC